MKKVFCLLLTGIIFLSSCSLKKRSYRPGYYIDFAFNNKTKHSSIKNKTSHSEQFFKIPKESSAFVETKEDPMTSAAVGYVEVIQNQKSKNNLQDPTDSLCEDVINFRSGKILTAKVLEITETHIKYKRCDNLEGPVFSINKNDIASVKYPNGTVETFQLAYTPLPTPVKRPVPDKLKRVHPLAWVVLAFTITIPVLGLISMLAIWLISPYAEMKIKQQPDRYKGLRMLDICNTVLRVYLGILVAAAILLVAILLLLL